MPRMLAYPNKVVLVLTALACTLVFGVGAASAQSGHFNTGGAHAPDCTDTGTTLTCFGKVSGLGGTTFRIDLTVEAAKALVDCFNPGQDTGPVPGQAFSFSPTGSTGTLATPRNGQFNFTISTVAPTTPSEACPNDRWTAVISDVVFCGTATLSLFEDNTLSDTTTVELQALENCT